MRKSDQANKVRAYIKANPKAKSSAVAKACGVSVQYVYSLKYHDKRKAKLKRKVPAKRVVPTPVNKLPEVQKATAGEQYMHLMNRIEHLVEMVHDRDVVIAYLEHKLEMRNETDK